MPKRHRQPDDISLVIVEDYGDGVAERESCGSDEFQSSDMGNDGNVSSPARTPRGTSDDDDNSSSFMMTGSDGDDGDNTSLIHVDFGVFEMRPRDVDASVHLMDQLCPDKINEVDRDELGAALLESPFTCVVKISGDENDSRGDEEAEEEEEEEVYGLASVLDVAHDARLSSLLEFLKKNIWRTIAPGILPTDMLTSVDDASAKAKCVLLIGEYIRNVPLELTSHILSDVVGRLEAALDPKNSVKGLQNTPKTAVDAVFPCMFAVLSKIQRALDDVSLTTTKTKTEIPKLAAKKTKHESTHKRNSMQNVAQLEEFDIRRYIFWREEDSIIYEYRDKRIATVAYRCRQQYDSQPESEIPISLMYVVPYGGLMQALAEIRRRETTQANVVRY